MKVLLVEDDENKRAQIAGHLRNSPRVSSVDWAGSYSSALKYLISKSYDIVVLDMTLPTFDVSPDDDGGRPQALGGQELLKQMKRRAITTPVVVVTQFDRFGERRDALTLEQLDRQLSTDHANIYIGSVYYNATVEGWKDQLSSFINRVLGSQESL